VLGSTGSIGVNTLDVARHLRETGGVDMQVVGLAAGGNSDTLIKQAKAFDVKHLAMASEDAAARVRQAIPDATVYAGADAAEQLIEAVDATDVTSAIVGSAGLPATLRAIERGMRIGLANKETLVAAGALVTPKVRQHEVELIPVDSEHSAIFQCLQGGPSEASAPHPSTTLGPYPNVKRIVLTASGGPFRTADRDAMQQATVEDALNHPTWKMGPKITIDSATMMNKALEIVEAHWLFGLPSPQISVIVHPQSVVHSFVEFDDNSVLAQLGPPDMRTPIQYALSYPDRPAGCSDSLNWTMLSSLSFEQPDYEKFPSLKLAYDVIDAGGTAGAIFNAANEAAVAAFLERRIRFGRIVELVAEALSATDTVPADSLETIIEADRAAREFVTERVEVTADA